MPTELGLNNTSGAIPGVGFDQQCSNIETKLTDMSRYFVVGTVAGLVKVVFGAGQTLVAAVGGTITGIGSVMGLSDKTTAKRCLVHIKHGLGNIGAGVVEAVPIVQQGVYRLRQNAREYGRFMPTKAGPLENRTRYYWHNQFDKWMPYHSLELATCEIKNKRIRNNTDTAILRREVGRDQFRVTDSVIGRVAIGIIMQEPLKELNKLASSECPGYTVKHSSNPDEFILSVKDEEWTIRVMSGSSYVRVGDRTVMWAGIEPLITALRGAP